MDSQQGCPPLAVWQQLLEGLSLGASANDDTRHLEICCRCQTIVEGLTGGSRTWLHITAELRQPAPVLPAAFRNALEQVQHQVSAPTPQPPEIIFTHGQLARELPRNSVFRRPPMTACIHVERMMHRSSIAVAGESAASYTLVKLIPSGLAGTSKPLGLNLALVLDVSGSMYEEDGTGVSRLQRVQNAALSSLQKLQPEDTLALIAFAQNARVLLPPTPIAERGKIEEMLRRIDTFDVDPGGTAMDEGLALALTNLEQHAASGKLSQIMILTDGETSGEQNCRILAQKAAEKKMHLTLMGIGLDWKAALLKDLANLSQGKWYYIDVQEAQETSRIFAEEFETLAATAFLDVELHLRPVKDVQIKRIRQVVPEINEIKLVESEGRHLVAKLGTLQQDVSPRYILDLQLPQRPDGKYAIAQLEVTYDLGTGQRDTSGPISLEMTYTAAGNGYSNAEVMRHIDDIQLKVLSDDLQKALQANDQQEAIQVAQELEQKASLMGERAKRKTMLVKQILDELNAEGRVRKNTQLALEDTSRRNEAT